MICPLLAIKDGVQLCKRSACAWFDLNDYKCCLVSLLQELKIINCLLEVESDDGATVL